MRTWLLGLDYGDIPTWIAVAATCVAVFFAVKAANKVYRLEKSRDETQDADSQRRQAERVCAWYYRRSPDLNEPGEWGAFIRNASEHPVYDAEVEFFRRGAEGRGWLKDPLVPPSDTPQFIYAPPSMWIDGESKNDFEVTITFTDTSGFRWHRDKKGLLRVHT